MNGLTSNISGKFRPEFNWIEKNRISTDLGRHKSRQGESAPKPSSRMLGGDEARRDMYDQGG